MLLLVTIQLPAYQAKAVTKEAKAETKKNATGEQERFFIQKHNLEESDMLTQTELEVPPMFLHPSKIQEK